MLEGQHPGGMGKAWLWQTSDGGRTWREHLHGKLGGYQALFCRGPRRFVLCGGFPAYGSDDGGANWRPEGFGGLLDVKQKIATAADVRAREGYVLYALGQRQNQRRLIVSHDAGRHWSIVAIPPGAGYYRDQLFFATSDRGWIGCAEGRVLATDDGGLTWTARDLPTDQNINALWFDPAGHGFAAVENSVISRRRQTLYETADAGRTWHAVLGGEKNVNAIFALDPHSLWAVGGVPGYVPNDLVAILIPQRQP